MYRPPGRDCDYAEKHPKDVIWIGGDANLPDIDWSSNSITGNISRKDINETMIQTLENWGMDQMVDFPTRERNLGIFCTNRPSLIQTCSPLPGISDREIVLVESNVSAKIPATTETEDMAL